MKTIFNRKARFHYHLLEEFEAGIVLSGAEAKSVKNGRIDISSAYISVSNHELYLIGATITRYPFSGTEDNYEPIRTRKLLMNKREIYGIEGKIEGERLTLVPIKVYTKRNRVKVGLALARGKSRVDKRESILKREALRSIGRMIRGKMR